MITRNRYDLQGDPTKQEGSSTDEKPSSAPENALFLELDTGKFFYFSGGEWIEVGTAPEWPKAVTMEPTDDYAMRYSSTAIAYLIEEDGKQYLKITGWWRNKGNNAYANVLYFKTNVNVGAQTEQVTVKCRCFYDMEEPSGVGYADYNGYVTTDGDLYLPLSHENVWRVFNQFDYYETMVELKPV